MMVHVRREQMERDYADSNIDFDPRREGVPAGWGNRRRSTFMVMPVSYLLYTGLPALRKGAATAGRSAPPSLVAHVLIAITTDRQSAMAAGHQLIDMYTRYLFYVKMFTSAGFPTTVGGAAPDGLVASLVISGDENMVTARFSELLASGLDELMVTLLPIRDADDEQFRLLHSVGRL